MLWCGVRVASCGLRASASRLSYLLTFSASHLLIFLASQFPVFYSSLNDILTGEHCGDAVKEGHAFAG
jgi:hypothetical protein